MVIILSPSKTSEVESYRYEHSTFPEFNAETEVLIQILKAKSKDEIKTLMSLSDKLTDHTFALIDALSIDYSTSDTRSAIFNFKGEVYTGLNALSFTKDDLLYAQNHLRILSGLYGILRPLDLIKTYRLEMGTRLKTPKGSNLYHFWDQKITDFIIQTIMDSESRFLLNLASDEYAKCLQFKDVQAKIIQPEFFDFKNGKKVFISFNAKKARGLMAAFVIKNKIVHPEKLTGFNLEGYFFDKTSSDDSTLVFLKKA